MAGASGNWGTGVITLGSPKQTPLPPVNKLYGPSTGIGAGNYVMQSPTGQMSSYNPFYNSQVQQSNQEQNVYKNFPVNQNLESLPPQPQVDYSGFNQALSGLDEQSAAVQGLYQTGVSDIENQLSGQKAREAEFVKGQETT